MDQLVKSGDATNLQKVKKAPAKRHKKRDNASRVSAPSGNGRMTFARLTRLLIFPSHRRLLGKCGRVVLGGEDDVGGRLGAQLRLEQRQRRGQSLSWRAWRSSSVALATSWAWRTCCALDAERLAELPLPNLGRGILTRCTSLSQDSMMTWDKKWERRSRLLEGEYPQFF